MKLTHKFTIAGREFSFELGKVAQQADSAVLARYGDTVVLATIVASKAETALSYFPLSVEYVEKLYAGGRIKGSRWVKREGRPSDDLILKGRVIDRSIRPLFPKAFKHDVQVITAVLSVDKENDPDMVALIAASCAIATSPVPWNGPIASVRMGFKDGKILVNPLAEARDKSDLDLVVSGTSEKVIMLEAGANQVPEDTMFEAIKIAHKEIKNIIENIQIVVDKVAPKKISVTEKQDDKKKKLDKVVKALSKEFKSKIEATLAQSSKKGEGKDSTVDELITEITAKMGEEYTKEDISDAVNTIFTNYVREMILKDGKRLDGRKTTEIRPLTIEVGVLPRTHGSAIFQRGSTQALSITTLGSPAMEQLLESAEGEETKRYIHHYDMPPYSVGETGRVGFASRREIGHGALAERALLPVIPGADKFPYTIRIVSEILSSNGSTSMASTCGSTLSLMDAGVPIIEPVAGISTGLITEGEKFVLLTDIMGVEDFNGDMDFKVAGTKNGITAIQLDMKVPGISFEIIEQTLKRAKEARMFILEKMLEVLPTSKPAISQYAPKIENLSIPVDRIGELIGPGGKNIRSIIADTGAEVNVEDSGVVTVSSSDQENVTKAITYIKNMFREIRVGEEFTAVVRRMMNFGAFVEYLPGKEGLVHLSQMSMEYVQNPEDVVKIGQEVKVRVIEIDEMGRTNLSMLTPEQSSEKRNSARSSGPRDGGGSENRGGDRPSRYQPRSHSNDRGGSRSPRPQYTHEHLKENR